MEQDQACRPIEAGRGVKVLIIVLMVLLGLSILLAKGGFVVFNWSGSEPRGLYVLKRQPTSEKDLALICLTRDQEFPAIVAGLDPGRGSCPSGFEPILKRLYRPTPQHPLRFDSYGFWLDEHLIPNTQPLLRSRFGTRFSRLATGRYVDGLFAISDYHPRSYDSRYFGRISESQVVSFAAPILVIP